MSSTTSPSILRLRPSAVYCGRGLSRMSTMVVGGSLAAFFFGAFSATVASAKPPLCTTPRFPPPLGGGVATPFPNPVLATVPRIPLAPPVPFPYPSPPGNAGEPRRSEEHTSELQSQSNLVCRLLLEKKKKNSV